MPGYFPLYIPYAIAELRSGDKKYDHPDRCVYLDEPEILVPNAEDYTIMKCLALLLDWGVRHYSIKYYVVLLTNGSIFRVHGIHITYFKNGGAIMEGAKQAVRSYEQYYYDRSSPSSRWLESWDLRLPTFFDLDEFSELPATKTFWR
ncbi:hypothetical protein K469DRAFT_692079 [Zopfia rhizophila CBS 207.26]|uniref:Uncharacterized protein n=1 Tax=Zopfia rhizophila CBS 207.26 TaxID=1314779 RepID=A0A6A6DS31_9PEZI|nr:hypothetical protein K469DRAFT_692079 [Zopfia rhizophila CBS 207.26]